MSNKTDKKEQVLQALNNGLPTFHNMGVLDVDLVTDVPLTDEEVLLLKPPFVLLGSYLLKPLKQEKGNSTFVYVIKTLSGQTTFVLDKQSSVTIKQMPFLQLPSNHLSPFDDEVDISPSNHRTTVTLTNTVVKDSMFSGDVVILNSDIQDSKIKNSRVNLKHTHGKFEKRSSIIETTLIESYVSESDVKGAVCYRSSIEKSYIQNGMFSCSIKESTITGSSLKAKTLLNVVACHLKDVNFDVGGITARQNRLSGVKLISGIEINVRNKFDFLLVDVPQTFYGQPMMIRTGVEDYAFLRMNTRIDFKMNVTLDQLLVMVKETFYPTESNIVSNSISKYIAATIYSRLKVCQMLHGIEQSLKAEVGVKEDSYATYEDKFYILD